MRANRVFYRNARVYARTWRSGVFFSFFQPLLFLSAIGFGVGKLIGADAPGGRGYLAFLAPALLAAACMQTATFESTYPLLGKIQWRRTYEAILATPISVKDLFAGEIRWLAMRMLMVGGTFAAVMMILGVGRTPWMAASLFAAILTGLVFATSISAFTARSKTGAEFNWLFRFVITPMFLFSGTFFPVDRLPEYLQPVAILTPLYHGVALARGFATETLTGFESVPHFAYLLLLFGLAYWLALRGFTKRLAS